jgi:hypothetical protein
MIKSALGKVMWLGRATVFVVGLAVILALVVGVASAAFGANGANFIRGNGINDTTKNIATLTSRLTMNGTASAPGLQVTQQSTGTGASGVGITVPTGKAPIKVSSGAGKATNLNADQVDNKSANDLSRVAVMNTSATTLVPADTSEVTYGTPLSITAPAAGFVRLNGNVTVLNDPGNIPKCTSGCQFVANVRHINTNTYGFPAIEDALNELGNAGLDAVFPVNAGVNTFDIRLSRNSSGESGKLYGYWGMLTAEYTPYGSTGTGTLSASGSAAASEGPISKELPTKR